MLNSKHTFLFPDLWSDNSFYGQINIEGAPFGFSFDISGGLATRPSVTEDVLILIGCHEIGHLMGGEPLKSPGYIISAEGQADYYATLKCARKYFQDEDNASLNDKKPKEQLK